MAIKGLSIPVFGNYNYDESTGKVSYTNGFRNPKACSYELSIESAEDNPLYADNQIAENDIGRFNTGTLSLETSDFTQETSQYLLNAKVIERTYGPGLTTKVMVFDDEQKSLPKGFGIIEMHQINNIDRYKAVILKKATFMIPSDAATTKGKTIEWQTHKIEATIARSDEVTKDENHPWKDEAWFDTEAQALEYLMYMLGVATNLTITSAAGTTSGNTEITVHPEKLNSSQYYYQTGKDLELPGGNVPISSLPDVQTWDGEAEITATGGQEIMIIEALNGVVVRQGITTVISNTGS